VRGGVGEGRPRQGSAGSPGPDWGGGPGGPTLDDSTSGPDVGAGQILSNPKHGRGRSVVTLVDPVGVVGIVQILGRRASNAGRRGSGKGSCRFRSVEHFCLCGHLVT
jgi:hypothetical protein